LGQIRVVDGPSHGDRADQDTEGEDGFAFTDLPAGVIEEVSEHVEADLDLAGAARARRASGTRHVCGHAGRAAAVLRMIAMLQAQTRVPENTVGDRVAHTPFAK